MHWYPRLREGYPALLLARERMKQMYTCYIHAEEVTLHIGTGSVYV